MLVDPHCHLDDPSLEGRLEAVLAEARAMGIGGALIPSYGPERWQRQDRLLAEQADFALWGGFGLHPWAIDPGHDFPCWRHQLETGWQLYAQRWSHRLIAIGEFGLDRSRRMAGVPLSLQREIFDWHLDKARGAGLPLILHLVRADGPALDLLGKGAPWSGVVHAFSSHPQTVPGYLKTGLCLSFGGGLHRSSKVRDALRVTPCDRLMLETDAPAGAGLATGGPVDLIEIAQAASQVLGKSVEYLLARHRENCARVFGLGS